MITRKEAYEECMKIESMSITDRQVQAMIIAEGCIRVTEEILLEVLNNQYISYEKILRILKKYSKDINLDNKLSTIYYSSPFEDDGK